jgi:hypothetical protein
VNILSSGYGDAGIGSGAVDDKGKAIFGSPGPGLYHTASLFNNDPSHPAESRAGKHVFASDGACTIKGRTQMAGWAADSPGPAAHSPDFNRVDANTKPAVFGRSDRETESKRFTSCCQTFSGDNGVPGPGAYRYKCGKGHERTLGDGPNVKMGTGTRPPINAEADPSIPGAKYNLPGAFDASRGYSIAPMNNRQLGMARDRATEAHESCKQYWGPGVPTLPSMSGPSPTAYTPNVLGVSSAHSVQPEFKFGKASIDADAKVWFVDLQYNCMK